MGFVKARFTHIEDALSPVNDGATVVIAGSMVNAPMSLVREVIRQGKKNLDLIVSPIGGINVDILIGAGVVRSIEFPQVSFGEFGLAPNFRRAAERKSIHLKEHT